MPNTILLKGDGVQKEGEASAAITPGDLIEFGGTNDLRVHAVAGAQARKAFALENDLVGRGVDDAYAAGDTVKYLVAYPGAELWARISEAVTKGDFLESAGDGRLQVASTPVEGSNIAVALETVGAAGRCRVEAL